MRTPRTPFVTAALLALAACGTASHSGEEAATTDYVVVFFEDFDEREVAPGEMQEVMSGHDATLRRLSDTEGLLLGGWFVPPRARPGLHGLLIFDTADVEAAHALASTDPAVARGVLAVHAYPWRGPVALRQVPELRRERLEELGPDTAPEAVLEPYVLVTSPDADAAARAIAPLRDAGRIAFFGRFGGELDGRALFALIERDDRAAAETLADLGPGAPAFVLHPWLGPEVLTRLAR